MRLLLVYLKVVLQAKVKSLNFELLELAIYVEFTEEHIAAINYHELW